MTRSKEIQPQRGHYLIEIDPIFQYGKPFKFSFFSVQQHAIRDLFIFLDNHTSNNHTTVDARKNFSFSFFARIKLNARLFIFWLRKDAYNFQPLIVNSSPTRVRMKKKNRKKTSPIVSRIYYCIPPLRKPLFRRSRIHILSRDNL
mmetsp:Transcript_4798/g.12318  ORF Transcript_4798/g.12318 Transcript_4798/m.12318 type:complete len:145 (+) Transcript_4798:1673-2107(+)